MISPQRLLLDSSGVPIVLGDVVDVAVSFAFGGGTVALRWARYVGPLDERSTCDLMRQSLTLGIVVDSAHIDTDVALWAFRAREYSRVSASLVVDNPDIERVVRENDLVRLWADVDEVTVRAARHGGSLESSRRTKGVCVRCGHEPFWRALAMFCPWHGMIL